MGRGKIIGALSSKLKLKVKPLGIDIIRHKDKDKRINFKKINALKFSLIDNQKFDLILIKQTIHLMKLNEIYFILLFLVAIQMIFFQLKKLDINLPENCLRVFKSNNFLGIIVYFAFLSGKI